MAFRSLLGLAWWSVLGRVAASPQGALTGSAVGGVVLATAVPDLASPQSSGAPACGGCYLVADVAGVVWYSEVFANEVATALVSVGNLNGSRVTSTSIVSNEGSFTFALAGSVNGPALQAVPYSTAFTTNGAVLFSPTAYNVFTAFSVTSAYLAGGSCVTVSGSRSVLSTAYPQILSAASGTVTLNQAGEQDFANYVGFSSCSGVVNTYVPAALVPVLNTTTTSTQTFTSSNVPLLQLTAASSASVGSASLVFPSASAPLIVVGNTTFTPTANPVALPTFDINGTVVAVGSSGGLVPLATRKSNFTTPTPLSYNGNNLAPVWLSVDLAFLFAWVAGMVGVGLAIHRF